MAHWSHDNNKKPENREKVVFNKALVKDLLANPDRARTADQMSTIIEYRTALSGHEDQKDVQDILAILTKREAELLLKSENYKDQIAGALLKADTTRSR